MSSMWLTLLRRATSAALLVHLGIATPLQAETQWQPINDGPKEKTTPNLWESVPTKASPNKSQVWEQLSPEEEQLEPEQLVWTEPKDSSDDSGDKSVETVASDEQQEGKTESTQDQETGLRWPNGQLMSEADQIYYRTAYSRGSMIQIGETLYPNLGFNALQRHPESFINVALVGIDDNRIGRPDCSTGDFFDSCSDGLIEGRLRLWNSELLSLDLHWTMHSLSGEGAPYKLEVGDETFGETAGGTKFGEGQSLGFVLSKNLGKTYGITFAGYRLFHLDEVTDLPRNFALYGTKVFRLNDSLSPPIISVSLGLMSDVYNIDTNLGSLTYPEFLRGGEFRSLPAELFGKPGHRNYYNDVSGVSSAFVCADQTVFAEYTGKKFKTFEEANPNCIKKVYFGPIASIGFAPWPWLGLYAKYGGTDIDLGISLKPFKNFPWTISVEALNPIKGINRVLDDSFDFKECANRKNTNFSDCRTRVGLFTELSF